MKVALCQFKPVAGDVRANAETVVSAVNNTDADLLVFPEMFLTDYSFKDFDSVKNLSECIDMIFSCTRRLHKAVIVGGPFISENGVFNSSYLISDDITRYDKIHLPGFGVFGEDKIFTAGTKPVMTEVCGFKIGLIICYDIFFPELVKYYAVNGADMIVCISASPTTSEKAFQHVVSARCVESTVYTVFVNNIGDCMDLKFFGKSRCITPYGDTIAIADGDSSVVVADIKHDVIEASRRDRPTLKDTRMHIGMP